MNTATQLWTHSLPIMQQTVLITGIRGPDGLPKYATVKNLLRWFRRCVLVSALDGRVITDPYDPLGGSFTGPSLKHDPHHEQSWEIGMSRIVDEYMRDLDAIPHHFQMHLMHAAEILGYKHPDRRIREWWLEVYYRLVNDMHVHPETVEELNERLGDTREGWLARADPATAS